MSEIRYPSAREIDAAKSPRGGYSKAQLAAWGVSWPPRPGWKFLLAEKAKHQRWVEKYGVDDHAVILARGIEWLEALTSQWEAENEDCRKLKAVRL